MTTSFSDDEMLMNGRRVELGGARGTTYPHVQPTNAGCTRKTTCNFENANLGNEAEWEAQSANEAPLGPKEASFALWAPHSALLPRLAFSKLNVVFLVQPAFVGCTCGYVVPRAPPSSTRQPFINILSSLNDVVILYLISSFIFLNSDIT